MHYFKFSLTQFEPPSEFNTSITRPAFGTHPAAVLASVLLLSADKILGCENLVIILRQSVLHNSITFIGAKDNANRRCVPFVHQLTSIVADVHLHLAKILMRKRSMKKFWPSSVNFFCRATKEKPRPSSSRKCCRWSINACSNSPSYTCVSGWICRNSIT